MISGASPRCVFIVRRFAHVARQLRRRDTVPQRILCVLGIVWSVTKGAIEANDHAQFAARRALHNSRCVKKNINFSLVLAGQLYRFDDTLYLSVKKRREERVRPNFDSGLVI